ncbi:hypothetical protein ACSDR0_28755 [Streptosporangium sp. G11]|uniref:hypothetical protein n=1 Tax=Streptosporangium sp. G11 TaxID=3436926 RepID=UPI003EBCFE54
MAIAARLREPGAKARVRASRDEGFADRPACLGAGAAHDGPAPSFESLPAALKAALTPRTRARARAVAGAIRADGPAVAATPPFDATSREGRPIPRDHAGSPSRESASSTSSDRSR